LIQHILTEDFLPEPQIDLSGRKIVKFFILSLILVLISDISTNFGFIYYCSQFILVLLLLAVFFLPLRPALVLLLLLTITGKDIVSSLGSASLGTTYATSSIWQLQLGVIRPSWIMFACIFTKLVQIKVVTVSKPSKCAVLWFATVPIIAGIIHGGFCSPHASAEVVIDIKFPLMLLGSTILFYSAFRNDRNFLLVILSAFIGALLARHLTDLVQFAVNFGPDIAEGVSRGSTDSAKGGVVFLIFWGACLFLLQKRPLLGIIISIPSVLLLAAYGTRMLWITFICGVIVMFVFLKLRQSLVFFIILIFLAAGGCFSLFLTNPKSSNVVLSRAKMITKGRAQNKFSVDVNYNIISRIDPVRYAEFFNIIDSLNTRYAYLWGTGYGGYYEDSIEPFPNTLKSSFPQYSLDTGKYYRAHGYPIQIFLKHGFVGLLIISLLWLLPWLGLLKIYKKKKMFTTNQPCLLNSTMICLAAFIPTAMLQLYWSGKGLFINGIVIAICMEFIRMNRVTT